MISEKERGAGLAYSFVYVLLPVRKKPKSSPKQMKKKPTH